MHCYVLYQLNTSTNRVGRCTRGTYNHTGTSSFPGPSGCLNTLDPQCPYIYIPHLLHILNRLSPPHVSFCSGPLPSPAPSIASTSSLLEKQKEQRDFTLPGSTPIPRAKSYEDFLRHKDLTLSSSKKSESSTGGSYIRKAKSESDVAVHSLKKKIDVSCLATIKIMRGIIAT